ncbi:hypothetical protein LTR36_001802 [Oleoguttula mirabilis]|uniref:Uncharacterized protein n=1 Tax=Oleoguttula mirabilis TaxID=1507867 RepID=A0AAV9JM42_9PEZI|nr:hypothetical protein LTR36_001802 [Oleoguttula mirabilis]
MASRLEFNADTLRPSNDATDFLVGKYSTLSEDDTPSPLLLTLVPLYYLSYKLHPTYSDLQSPSASESVSSRDGFTKRWLQTQLLEPLNPSAIRAYCNTTTWQPNLIFNLADANGGVGNVRASVLDFVFYAIEAGAAIALPQMTVRSQTDLFDVWHGGHANFSRMLDDEWFKESLSEACPQMTVYDPPDDGNWTTVAEAVVDSNWLPHSPTSRRHTSRSGWLEQAENWMKDHGVEEDKRTLVHLGRTMWEVDTRNLPPAFRLSFPMALRVNPGIRRFASAAMANLVLEHGVPMKPDDHLHQRAFYGAHLCTEADTVSAGGFIENGQLEAGANWTAQTDNYIEQALQNELHIIFAASGNTTELTHLLSAAEVTELGELDWDQQALVNLEILMRCSVFGVFAKSGFAFAIVVARNAWAEQQGIVMQRDPWFAKHVNPGVAFDDGLSRIIGRNQLNEERVPRGAWPG